MTKDIRIDPGKGPFTDGVSEAFFIAQASHLPKEDLTQEEGKIIDSMGFKDVRFDDLNGMFWYRYQNDAIAVGRQLSANKPARKLAVVSAVQS